MTTITKIAAACLCATTALTSTAALADNPTPLGGSGYWTAYQWPNACTLNAGVGETLVRIATGAADQRLAVEIQDPRWNMQSGNFATVHVQFDNNPNWGLKNDAMMTDHANRDAFLAPVRP